jgi:hypothetical protein
MGCLHFYELLAPHSSSVSSDTAELKKAGLTVLIAVARPYRNPINGKVNPTIEHVSARIIKNKLVLFEPSDKTGGV